MAKSQPKEPERLVGVLKHGQPSGSHPGWFITREEAQYLLDCQFAYWRRRWLIVLRKPLPLKLRDASSNIREHTILAAASGSKYHRALIEEAWG